MMKKSLIILAFSLFALPIWAQFELKTSPIALLFPDAIITIGGEFGINTEIGIDGDLFISPQGDGAYFNLAGKYYFNPKLGIDKFHAGVFLGLGEATGAGFLAGYK